MDDKPTRSVGVLHSRRLTAALLADSAAQITRGLTADELVAYCEKIAAASGGILGLRWQYFAGREITPGAYRLRFEDAQALRSCEVYRRVRYAEPALRV